MNEPTRHVLQHTAEAMAGTAAVASSGWVIVRVWKRFRAWLNKPSLAEAISKLSETLDGIKCVIDNLAKEMANTAESLHITNSNVQILLDNDPVARWWTDPDGKCRDVNRALCKLFGMTRDEMLGDGGHGWMRAIHEDHRAEVLRKFKHAIAEGIPYQCTYAINARTGGLQTVVAEGDIIKTMAGKVLTVAGTVRPIKVAA
jgi:PAS domain S-box-containing protein